MKEKPMNSLDKMEESPIKRAKQMLILAGRYIEEHYPEGTIHYDGTDCDGYCVAADCAIAAEELVESANSKHSTILEDYYRLAKLTEKQATIISMQAEALKRASISLGSFCSDEGWGQADMDTMDCVDATISASAESVAAWEREKLEPLQRQVAMLHLCAEDRGIVINGLILERERSQQRKKVNSESNSDLMADDCARLIRHFTDLNDTQATAEAYEREHAAKVRNECIQEIEMLRIAHDPRMVVPGDEYYAKAISTLRATNKEPK